MKNTPKTKPGVKVRKNPKTAPVTKAKPKLKLVVNNTNPMPQKFPHPFSKFMQVNPPANAFNKVREYGIRVGRIKKIA